MSCTLVQRDCPRIYRNLSAYFCLFCVSFSALFQGAHRTVNNIGPEDCCLLNNLGPRFLVRRPLCHYFAVERRFSDNLRTR
ncbi:uncharacterized protein BJX67DRAFT_228258 [Aspergillus lucknowensis]|uniref:Secreted protein n=1 Tax=Aspergillus lucknowensis TaxID=176173 RepID=A0ABR4LI59_9EURO